MAYLRMSHRGAQRKHVENTLEAFEEAYKAGIRVFETDVRLTKDNVPVIFHDPVLKRLCKDKRRLQDLTLEEFSVLSKKGCTFLSVEELLTHYTGKGVRFNFELKVPCVPELLAVIKQLKWQEDVVLSSFFPAIIKELIPKAKGIPIGLVANYGRFLVKKAKTLGINVLIINNLGIRKYHVVQAHKEGIPVWTWPVNTKKRITVLESWGIDGIMTDIPELFD